MPKLYKLHVTVEGDFHFPIDMLRYDRLTPATEADSSKIAKTHAVMHDWPTVRINLVSEVYSPKDRRPFRPNAARWHSNNGWKIIKAEEEVIQS